MILTFRFIFFFLLLTTHAYSQSLIVGIPNAEVAPKGKLLLAHESQLNTWDFPQNKWTSFNFSCYGIGHHIELCVTAFNVASPASLNMSVSPGAKMVFPFVADLKIAHDFTLGVGQMMPISLDGKGFGSWSYGIASIRFNKLNTRLTAGPSYGTRQIFGRSVLCLMLGYEQPLTEKLSLVGDWYSGTHDIGAYISAIQYNFTPEFTVITGYKIPNNALSGFHAYMLEITLLL
jgi:hypothetical protein